MTSKKGNKDIRTFTVCNFIDADGETLYLTDAPNYNVVNDLIKEFRKISGYEDGTMEGEDYDYNYEDFESFANEKGYMFYRPMADFDVSF